MALTFEELKKEIMKRARNKEICADFQNILLAKSYLEILEAGKKFPTWVWASNIMDVDLLKEFPEQDLLDANIYVTSSRVDLLNVSEVIYILPGADVNLQCDNENKCEIICIGGNLEVHLIDKSFAKIKGFFDSKINLVASNESISSVALTNQSTIIFKSEDSTNSNVIINQNAKCEVESYGFSFVNLKATENSEINYQLLEDSEIQIKATPSVSVIDNNPK